MPSPFPGMDPYLEDPAVWRDFHTDFLANVRAALNAALPESYSAQIEEAVRIVQFDPPAERATNPDVTVTRDPSRDASAWPVSAPADGGGVAVLEPVTLDLPDAVEVRDRWVEVRHLPGRELVTVIELLSPTNKSDGRDEYLAKRLAFLKQPVHVVEIDLLLGGRRLPMSTPLPAGDYFAIVSRAADRPHADVYAWALARPLPTIRIPLRAPDPDRQIDLSAAFAETYRRAAYQRLVDYARPPAARLSPAALEWATAVARKATA
jgi:hypothetical protein